MRFGMPGTPTELNPTSQVLTDCVFGMEQNHFYGGCIRTSLSRTLLPYVM